MAEVTNLEHKMGTLADAHEGRGRVHWRFCSRHRDRGNGRVHGGGFHRVPHGQPHALKLCPTRPRPPARRIVGTGRSDFPNQINNVLAFPGIFRGALDCRASCINEEMKVATSIALANLIPEDELNEENIIASALDKSVAKAVAAAVVEAAHKTGVARI